MTDSLCSYRSQAQRFIDDFVTPSVADYLSDLGVLHRATASVLIVDAFVGWGFPIYEVDDNFSEKRPANDTELRQVLCRKYPEYRPLFEIAKALKHGELTRGSPQILKSARSTKSQALGFGEAAFGEGRYGGLPQVVVQANDTTWIYFEEAIKGALRAFNTAFPQLDWGLVKGLDLE
jgi:hypothetical protein